MKKIPSHDELVKAGWKTDALNAGDLVTVTCTYAGYTSTHRSTKVQHEHLLNQQRQRQAKGLFTVCEVAQYFEDYSFVPDAADFLKKRLIPAIENNELRVMSESDGFQVRGRSVNVMGDCLRPADVNEWLDKEGASFRWNVDTTLNPAPVEPVGGLTGSPFREALEQPAYQKTPDYQARCKKALLVLNEIREVEKDSTNSFDERERKSQRLAALKVELAEINFPGDSQQKTIEPQATTPSPAPVVNSKRNKNKPSIETVALDYMCAEFKQGQFQSAAKFHKHLIKSVGVKDSPFEMGTGTNALKLFCPAAGSFFDVGTLGNVWPKIRAS